MRVNRCTQSVEDLCEARAISDHLERLLFRMEQKFRSFKFIVSRHKFAGPQRNLSIEFMCNPLLFTRAPELGQPNRRLVCCSVEYEPVCLRLKIGSHRADYEHAHFIV